MESQREAAQAAEQVGRLSCRQSSAGQGRVGQTVQGSATGSLAGRPFVWAGGAGFPDYKRYLSMFVWGLQTGIVYSSRQECSCKCHYSFLYITLQQESWLWEWINRGMKGRGRDKEKRASRRTEMDQLSACIEVNTGGCNTFKVSTQQHKLCQMVQALKEMRCFHRCK